MAPGSTSRVGQPARFRSSTPPPTRYRGSRSMSAATRPESGCLRLNVEDRLQARRASLRDELADVAHQRIFFRPAANLEPLTVGIREPFSLLQFPDFAQVVIDRREERV